MKHVAVAVAAVLAFSPVTAFGQGVKDDGIFDLNWAASASLRTKRSNGWTVVSIRLIRAFCGDTPSYRQIECTFRELVLQAPTPSVDAPAADNLQICRLGSWNGSVPQLRCKTYA